MKKNIIIADNQFLTRMGLMAYMRELFGDRVSLCSVSTKKALIATLTDYPGSIVMLDFSLFDITSIDSLLILGLRFDKAHWVLVSQHFSKEFIIRMSVQENTSLLSKSSSAQDFHLGISLALEHRSFYNKDIADWLQERDNEPTLRSPLTKTEKEILRLLAEGMNTKSIATSRHSSVYTVATHKKNIFRKLDVNNVYEAVRYAVRAGIVKPF